jgi:urocanate reductase
MLKKSVLSMAITLPVVLVGCAITSEIIKSQGTAKGRHGDIIVETTFENGKITAIDILKQKENKVLSAAVYKDVKQAIIDHNSVNVDGITGATATSNGLKKAVAR